MKLIVSLAAMAMCMLLLRAGWRMLVEIPDARQVWVPDVVDDLLSRLISAALILDSGLFLIVLVQTVG